MTTSSSPLPSGSDYIAATRSSCEDLSTALGLMPNTAAIDAFLSTLSESTFARLKTQHGLTFPLRFPSPLAELNFLSLLALLNAYSGYRVAFHTQTGSGAYQNIVRLMMGLYIAGGEEDGLVGSSALTAKGMVALTEAKIVELLGVSVHEEREHETLQGVTVGVRGGDMLDCVQAILTTLQRTGQRLLDKGFASLGAYIASLLTTVRAKQMGDEEATNFLVKAIAETLPAFRDTHTLADAKEVFLFKRIFFLLHSLRLRFADHAEWGVPDTVQTLPMFVDNVLPTLCVWFHLLNVPAQAPGGMETLFHWVRTQHVDGELTRETLERMQKNVAGPKLSVDETYAIRAATLHLGRVVVERAKALAKQGEGREWLAGLNEVDLDGYLWAVAKDDALLRKVPRFAFASIHF